MDILQDLNIDHEWIKHGDFNILKLKLNDDETKPVLVALAGFSNKSFNGSSQVIINNLNKINEKFNSIYIICVPEERFKKLQKEACNKRDIHLDNREISSLTKEEYNQVFSPETELNILLASEIHELLQIIIPTNIKIHLLGKCAGCGVLIKLFAKYDIYNALYLGVPACPTNVEEVDFNDRKLIIAWDKRDAYLFPWNKSNKEILSYKKTLDSIDYTNYILAEFNDGEEHATMYHEIPDGLFDLIRENN